MEEPLWTDRHRPSIDDFPQQNVRDRLQTATDSSLNLFIYGPKGVGKTAAANAVAEELHEDSENDVVTINVSDFFNRSKKEIRNDPRFKRFLQGQTAFSKQYLRGSDKKKYKRNWSKRDMIAHVIDEYAAIPPASSEYKTLILDNAEDLREDFQQALRRIMERHYGSTHFIFTSRSSGGIIPAIKSRCLPVPMTHPSTEELVEILTSISQNENVDVDTDTLNEIATRVNGNVRQGILTLQAVSMEEEVTVETAREVFENIGYRDYAESIFDDMERNEFRDARKTIDSLLDDEGFNGRDVLELLNETAHERYGGESVEHIVKTVAETDFRLSESSNDRIHLAYFISEIAAEV